MIEFAGQGILLCRASKKTPTSAPGKKRTPYPTQSWIKFQQFDCGAVHLSHAENANIHSYFSPKNYNPLKNYSRLKKWPDVFLVCKQCGDLH
ncbi:TPA: hypothetical protein ACV5RJ_003687 [Enterobacter roggenkampii]